MPVTQVEPPAARLLMREPLPRGDSAGSLMLRIRAGDTDAFECLMKRYWARLVTYAFNYLNCMDDASDVAQEVFARTWEHRYRWRPGGSVESFLFGVAKNLSLLRLRHRSVRARREPEIRLNTGATPTPVDHTLRSELREILEAALGTLPDRRKQAFVLVRMDGLSLGAAAEHMGVTKRTVANHVYMATTDLEEALAPLLS